MDLWTSPFGPARVLTDRVDSPWITLHVIHRLTTLADFSPTTPPVLLLIWMEQQKKPEMAMVPSFRPDLASG